MQILQILIDWLFGSLPLLGKLFLNYISQGPFFVVLHLIVVWLFYHTWYDKISVETRALENWRPRTTPAPSVTVQERRGLVRLRRRLMPGGAAETTRILDEFVADCDKLGAQGFFVPMTDFSDRLDSIVDGITAEMHDRTNLFILVGVAGTLLGIFEFAFESHRVIQENLNDPGKSLPALSGILTSSMSKAFPVGFVGLLLTFLAQVIASFPERRLRTALADAIGKALEAREGASRSHASSLQDSVRTMQETMSSSVSAMEAALRPLANLQRTLGEFLEPTMNELSSHLDKSLELVSAQHEEMKKTNEGTQEIVSSAKQAVAELREIVQSQVEQAHQTREVNKNTISVMRQQQESLVIFNDTLNANLERAELLNDTVARAATGVEALPDRLHGVAQMAFDQLTIDTLSVWRSTSDELKHQIADEHEKLLDGVAAQAKEIHDTLLSASSELGGVAAGVAASIEGLKTMPEHLEAEMKKVFSTIALSSTDYWNTRTDRYMEQMSTYQANFLDVIRAKTEDVERSLREASDHLIDISRRMDIILGDSLKLAIGEAKSELSNGLQHINRVLVEQYPQLSQNVLALSDGMKEAVARSGDIQRESVEWLSGIQSAQARLEEINRLLAEALTRAREETSPTNAEQVRSMLQRNVDELKGISQILSGVGQLIPAPEQVRGVSEQLRDGLDRTTRLLNRIHEDLTVKQMQEPTPDGGFWQRLPWPFSRRGNNGG